MASLDANQAQASIDRLAARLDGMPGARERSKTGDPSVREKLDQWSARIGMGDMEPAALPDLLTRQATRYARAHPDVAQAIHDEESALRRLGGGVTYGAVWYFGRHRTGHESDHD